MKFYIIVQELFYISLHKYFKTNNILSKQIFGVLELFFMKYFMEIFHGSIKVKGIILIRSTNKK